MAAHNPWIFWSSRTPPLMSRNNQPADYHRRQNGISTLNRNFGSLFGNRLAISNLQDILNYTPSASTSKTSAPFQQFNDCANGAASRVPFNGRLPRNSYNFGNHNNTGYNTVHKSHSISHSAHSRINAGSVDEYEDLDYYERPPIDTSTTTRNDGYNEGQKFDKSRSVTNSSPQYNESSTMTTSSGSYGKNSTADNSNVEVPSPTPFYIPSITSASTSSMKKNGINKSEFPLQAKIYPINEKKNERICCKSRSTKICVIAVLCLLLPLVLVAGTLTVSYIFYVQRKDATGHASLSDFLHDSSLLFQQKPASQFLNRNGSAAIRVQTNDNNLNWSDQTVAGWSLPEFGDYRTTTIFDRETPDELSRFSAHKIGQKSTNRGLNFLPELEKSSVTNDMIIEPRHLLTLQITKRKICLFEVSTSEQEQSRREFRSAHIPGARLLFYSSLSHNGVPIHPLQFQRYARSLSIDTDCRIVLYDRGQQMWSAYAFWIFQLYGHSKVSLLNGGFDAWQALTADTDKPTTGHDEGTVYRTENGSGTFTDKWGNFRANWNSDVISTFDDVLAIFEARNDNGAGEEAEIIDAQVPEEFDGTARGGGVIFGHIRGAINLPTERLYNVSARSWLSPNRATDLFRDEKALLDKRRVLIVYDGMSLRAAMVWLALRRQGYARSSVYFGSWSEWVIRAPDYLKAIPDIH